MVAPNADRSGSPSRPSPTPAPASGEPKPPVSPAKLAANRANAQKSTGPRTEAGKSASRMNAVRHGLRAELCVLPGEDAEEFAEFVDSAVRELRPAGALQASYAREVAVQTWRLRRVPMAERLLFARHDPFPADYEDELRRDQEEYQRLKTCDGTGLSFDDAMRLEELTDWFFEADRRRLMRDANAAGAGYLEDNPAYTAEVVAGMLRSRRLKDHAPDSVLWHCQRYEPHILRARSTALRELLRLQKAYGVAPEGEEVWPGEQIRVGCPDLPEEQDEGEEDYEDEDDEEHDEEDDEDGDEEGEDGDEEREEGPGEERDGEADEEAEGAAPNEPNAPPADGTPATARAPNEGADPAPGAARGPRNVQPRAERTQRAPARAPAGPATARDPAPASTGGPRATR
jgi:hypothetical protein